MDKHANIILDNIDAVVSICDFSTYEVLYLNKKAIKLYGNNTGQKCWTFLHNESEEACSFCPKNIINSTSENKKEFIWEAKHPATKKWYEAHSKIIDYKGIKAILEISYDISDRKKDEKQILNFLNYQNIISAVANVFNTSLDFNTKLDKSLEAIGVQLNLRSTVILEKFDDKLKIINIWTAKDIPNLKETFLYTNLSEKDFNIKKINKKDRIKSNRIEDDFSGNTLEILKNFGVKSVFLLPIKIENETVGYFILQDTNENRRWHVREINLYKTVCEIFSNGIRRKQNEDKILKSQKELKEANLAKDKFFSIIAHDLKNPIYNVVNLSTYLKDNIKKWDENKIQQFANYISEASTQASELLENLLSWARSQTGKINIVSEKINIKSFFDSIKVSVNNLLLDKNLKFKIFNKIEFDYIWGDKNMISTILRNLITNAIKYTPEGGKISITISKFEELDKKYFKIKVKDTGIGIAQKDIHKLFKIEESHSTPGTNDEGGTGLGLILCREFVEKHNGRIWVESEVGKGSQFYFTIPVVDF